MQSPITIVIPVYNRAHVIGRTLRSIDAQTQPPAHVILVDNNSTDSSMSVISDWAKGKDHVSILSEPARGACAARNRGLREVHTEWTMFFDSDDVMHPSHVRDFTHAISAHPTADVIGRDILYSTIEGKVRRLYFRAGRDAMFHHLFRGCLSTQRYVARTSLFRTAGGWDETLHGWNDLELGVRVLMHARNTINLGGAPTVTTYQQSESITGLNFSSHPRRWEDSLLAIRRDFESMPDSDSRKYRYIDWLDARAMILAAHYENEARAYMSSSDTSNRPSPQPANLSDYRKAHSLAVSLYNDIISHTRHPRRQRLIYLHNLHFRRLTWLLAKTTL